MRNIDYYNCSPCDFETESAEEYGYRWNDHHQEYVRIENEEEEMDDFQSKDLEDQFDQILTKIS